jgi:hypothetical protein|nr:MAG TPA_asm: hypothetical protein [Caudoviricetes sp.]
MVYKKTILALASALKRDNRQAQSDSPFTYSPSVVSPLTVCGYPMNHNDSLLLFRKPLENVLKDITCIGALCINDNMPSGFTKWNGIVDVAWKIQAGCIFLVDFCLDISPVRLPDFLSGYDAAPDTMLFEWGQYWIPRNHAYVDELKRYFTHAFIFTHDYRDYIAYVSPDFFFIDSLNPTFNRYERNH